MEFMTGIRNSTGLTAAAAMVRAVDLFCGAGGLTKGLESVGIDVGLGIDVDPACEYPYTANNRAAFLLKDIKEVRAQDLDAAFGEAKYRLLAGCAPCQTFSTYNQKARPDDARWWLLAQFSRLVREVKPELVTMENVPLLTTQGVFEQFLKTLNDLDYDPWLDIVNCSDYGVPQCRRRLVLMASRLGPIRLLDPSELGCTVRTVRESISKCPPLEAGCRDQNDELHQAARLSDTNLARIRASRPGGTWRDWTDAPLAECHKRASGKTYPGVYARMSWDEPAPTITTQFYGFGNGRFGHPEQDRAISLREGAILQGFPSDYAFVRPDERVCKKPVGRLIGNAVPVDLGAAIGLSIAAHVHEIAGESRDRRFIPFVSMSY